jgi:hypothetical protein
LKGPRGKNMEVRRYSRVVSLAGSICQQNAVRRSCKTDVWG